MTDRYHVWIGGRRVPLVAGGTNVASTLTDSGPGHIAGYTSWTIDATDRSGMEIVNGSRGAILLTPQIGWGLDQPWFDQRPGSPYGMGVPLRVPLVTNRRLDTDQGSAYYGGWVAPASWLDPISGETDAPAPPPPPPAVSRRVLQRVPIGL